MKKSLLYITALALCACKEVPKVGHQVEENQESQQEMLLEEVEDTLYTEDENSPAHDQFAQLLSCCQKPEAQELLRQEWKLGSLLTRQINTISHDIVLLEYWEGSIVGEISDYKSQDIAKARAEMYSKLLRLVRDDEPVTEGVAPKNAAKFLVDCCQTASEDLYTERVATFYNPPTDQTDYQRYQEAYNETAGHIKALQTTLDKWVALWAKLDAELMADGGLHFSERVASTMLINWASTTSSN